MSAPSGGDGEERRAYAAARVLDAPRNCPAHNNDKRRWLADFYQTAQAGVVLPVPEDSEVIRMFRFVLRVYLHLCCLRAELEKQVVTRLSDHSDFRRLQPIPGIVPILAGAGDCAKRVLPGVRFAGEKVGRKIGVPCFPGLILRSEKSPRRSGIEYPASPTFPVACPCWFLLSPLHYGSPLT
ncbi:MAG: hypothetical protein LAO04_12580 [Acidobacteriia bacterium]|nr:hypothetical protein [Terriglobia bacterium]